MITMLTKKNTLGTYEPGSYCIPEHRYWNLLGEDIALVDKYKERVISINYSELGKGSSMTVLVWNNSKQCTEHIYVDLDVNHYYGVIAKVDITPTLYAKYVAWQNELMDDARKLLLTSTFRIVRKESKVRSIAKRGKSVGFEGIVVWKGPSKFDGEPCVCVKDFELDEVCFIKIKSLELWEPLSQTWVIPIQ